MGTTPEWRELLKYYNRHYACGLFLARRFVSIHPENMFGWLVLGEILGKMNRFEEAHKAIKRSYQFTTDQYICQNHLFQGELFLEKGSLCTAEKWLRKSLEADPQYIHTLATLGECLHLQEKTEEAKDIYRKLIRRKTAQDEKSQNYYRLGSVLRTEMKYREAFKYFNKALELNPKYKQARLAVKDLKRAFQPPQKFQDPRQELKRLTKIHEQGLHLEVLKTAELFLGRYPKAPPAWSRVGQSLALIGRYKEARKAHQRALKYCLEKHRFLPMIYLGNMYYDQRTYRQAEQWYRKSLSEGCKSTQLFVNLADSLLCQGKITEARPYLRKAIKADTGPLDEAYDKLASTYYMLENYDKAYELLKQSLEINPKRMNAKRGLRDIELLEKLKEKHKASKKGQEDERRTTL